MRIAALDLGSNSFHLLVVETRPDGSFVPLVREKEMLRLGDVVAREGVLTDEAIEAAIDTVRRFKTMADIQQIDEIVAMGTAALREAANGPAAVERIEEETGVTIKVVSGIREAQLIFDAVRASVLIDPGPGAVRGSRRGKPRAFGRRPAGPHVRHEPASRRGTADGRAREDRPPDEEGPEPAS